MIILKYFGLIIAVIKEDEKNWQIGFDNEEYLWILKKNNITLYGDELYIDEKLIKDNFYTLLDLMEN